MAGAEFIAMVSHEPQTSLEEQVRYSARIAIYDDLSSVPRVVLVEPAAISAYLSQITERVFHLAHELGGTIPFAIIREIVENYIHAAFIEPSISIFDGGNTIRFCDQGPGITNKSQALEIGTTSATDEMKHYIRGVGSGLPIALQYMSDKGGSLTIEDNIGTGTIVTISTRALIKDPFNGPTTARTDQGFSGVSVGGETSGPLDDRSLKVFKYFKKHERVGVTELVEVYGSSPATWSRVLLSLDRRGYTQKMGQKRQLTSLGKVFLSYLK